MAERKNAMVRREMTAKVAEVEAAVAKAKEATSILTQSDVDTAADDVKGACEKAGTIQLDAGNALAAVKNAMTQRQREAKANAALDGAAMQNDLNKLAEQVT